MHIRNDINAVDFLREVGNCEKNVIFETAEGDCLALKSALSNFIFYTIASNPNLLQSGTIRFESETDQELLAKFLCD